MRTPATLLLVLLFCIPLTLLSAEPDPTYLALRAARPDGRVITLNGFVFESDVVKMKLTGALHLLSEVEGKTPGAVFTGQGSYELTPASPNERHQLSVVTAQKDLTSVTDDFDSAIFLGTAIVLDAMKHAAPAQSADPKAAAKWDDYMKRQRKDLHTNIHVRLLQEIVDGQGPFFLAWLNGRKHPPAALIIDPRGAESVRLMGNDLGGEQTMLAVIDNNKGGIWYSSRYRSEVEKGSAPVIPPLADAEHYLIDATIRGAELSATTTMTFVAGADLRVLPIDLTSRLRLSSVEFAPAGDAPAWTPVAFIQEKFDEDPDAAVVFPALLKKGERYLLRFTYAGREVLQDAGDGNFFVTRRTSWYPNVGVFRDMATFEMRFRTPQKFQIVGVGKEVENRVEGKDRLAVWKAERPLRVAGFNYGEFKKLEQTDPASGMTFEVYTNPGTPDIIREINRALQGEIVEPGEFSEMTTGPSHVKVNTASLAQSAMADGINTGRIGTLVFGPLIEKRVAITQQSQWFFGQSWPTLIYLPYISFLNSYTRFTLTGMTSDFVDNVGTHEVGHQWWGHQVGTYSYRDEWISEGFAEFTASLVAQQTGGGAKYLEFYDKAKKTILEKPRGAGVSNPEAGPISQGWRLATWRNGNAYGATVYSKGAYVLHMLRMAMWDRQSGDDKFAAMMKEFVATWSGRNATTADFQRVVEKHATPNLRVTQDQKLDWFFGQWVDGMAIPRIESKLDSSKSADGKYKVKGTITQSGVPDNFVSIVGVYVHFDKTQFAKLGTIAVVGNTSKPIEVEVPLPKAPQKFSINAMNDVLSR